MRLDGVGWGWGRWGRILGTGEMGWDWIVWGGVGLGIVWTGDMGWDWMVWGGSGQVGVGQLGWVR